MINFTLPKNLIAQTPAHPRDAAKLLVYNRETKKIEDSIFRQIDDYLPKNTTLVLNNSKVENCRWLFRGGLVEIFMLEKLDNSTIDALVRPGRKFSLGSKVQLTDNIFAEVIEIKDHGIRSLALSCTIDDVELKSHEHVPLPPYIAQDDKLADEYQTVYASSLGSKAAPTAGLHFTDTLLKQLKASHDVTEITLHVGLGTFAKLTEEQLLLGKLHEENFYINKDSAEVLRAANHITAVGTTSVRTLESLERLDGQPASGSTDIFIRPGYSFKHVNSMITNFHLPGTSLLLLVEAFVGSEAELLRIYEHAIKNDYRFYSFGDAMLII